MVKKVINTWFIIKKIYATRDVIFHEHIFPYKMLNVESFPLVLPLPPIEMPFSTTYPLDDPFSSYDPPNLPQ